MNADPWSRFTPAQIAEASGCPQNAVEENWQHIAYALDELGIFDPFVQTAAIATTAVETAWTFRPIEEYRNADGSIPSSWYGYGGGWVYHGRGFVQTTHLENYRALGDHLGIDLVAEPWRALEPSIAAWGLAYYFLDHGVAEAARAQDWRQTRILVNGGLNGWSDYSAVVDALVNMPEPPPDLSTLRGKLQAVMNAAATQIGKPYAGPMIGGAESDRWGEPGFDCSSLWAWAYREALGIALSPNTDAMFAQTVEVEPDDLLPGDLIFYRYADPRQPTSVFPHMGAYNAPNETLECRYPQGVGWFVPFGQWELRRVATLAEPIPPEDPCAALRAVYARLRDVVDTRPYRAPSKKRLLEILNA